MIAWWLAGCGDPPTETPDDPAVAPQIALERVPAAGPDPFVVHVAAADTALVSVRADGVDVDVVAVDGGFEARVEPARDDVVVPVEVDVDGVVWARDALVLAIVDDHWGQPELVPGLVNTPGYEDSAEVSPDGEWLVVGSYSPLDAISCLFATVDAPACQEAVGPYTAPERPGMPGADRISADGVDHTIPRLGLETEDGEPLGPMPPVASYGFRRQDDGSYAEPFVLALDADGWPASPFGHTFLADGRVVFSSPDVVGGIALYVIPPLTGDPVDLGRVSFDGAGWSVEPPPERLPFGHPDGLQSNPYVAADAVYYDHHFPDLADPDLWVARDGGRAAPERVAASQVGREEFQPYLSGGRLYFASGAFEDIRSAALDGDPTRADAFGPERVEVGRGVEGTVAALGEPSVAVVDGVEWLHFVVGRIVEGGSDSGVARVPAR